MRVQLHKAQISILYSLRHTPEARFSELMQPTGMQGDVFKFHIRKLEELGYIRKGQEGAYGLTVKGKEFANNLDEEEGVRQRQPKLSVIVLVMRRDERGKLQILAQQRKRQPYLSYWGVVGGPVQWGEQLEETGARELRKQTGLTANCRVQGFYRKQDYTPDGILLEDKLFAVLKAEDVEGELSDDWPWGTNTWMTLDEFKEQPKYFASVADMVDMLDSQQTYVSNKTIYAPGEY